ncbi:NADAR family protein [Sphingobacterium tabacisoli]|uniref:NADAR family protein n=1 Tax=Sphingobacterium tabacisoli TaxID=2044855 RepID=A0ABW5L1W6_9SPHI|nr:NADAR family protein [Sphingobacterium tabacisoli]
MNIKEKIYNISDSVVFSKTTAAFGGLSNMASGYSLFVNEVNIANSEILYQICRFPLFPKLQEDIISLENPMEAKALARKYEKYTRQDWENVKVDIMRWCLQVKLIQNEDTFSELLKSTGDKAIVEYSAKDPFWGAVPTENGKLQGKNVLGRLLTEVREIIVKQNQKLEMVSPLTIPAFLLFNYPIEAVHTAEYSVEDLDNVYAY